MNVDLEKRIKRAMREDGRTVYALAKAAGLWVSLLQKFMSGGGMTLTSASKLCEVLGLDLLPVKTPKVVKGRAGTRTRKGTIGRLRSDERGR